MDDRSLPVQGEHCLKCFRSFVSNSCDYGTFGSTTGCEARVFGPSSFLMVVESSPSISGCIWCSRISFEFVSSLDSYYFSRS